jgi:hypothetical protein
MSSDASLLAEAIEWLLTQFHLGPKAPRDLRESELESREIPGSMVGEDQQRAAAARLKSRANRNEG